MLPKLETDLDVIAKLDNEPNDVGGLTAEQLKAKFDEAANLIKEYINDTLLPFFNSENAAAELGISRVAGLTGVDTVQRAFEKIEEQMADMTQGAVADESITTAKLALYTVTAAKIADLAIVTAKLANGAVTTEKLADGAVTSEILSRLAVITDTIADLAVTEPKLADGSVSHRTLGDSAVGSNNIDVLAVTEPKLSAEAVSTRALKNESVTTDKLATASVTREKLADSAKYSGYYHFEGNVTVNENMGNAVLHTGTNGAVFTVNIDNVPNMFEFSVLSVYGNEYTVSLIGNSNLHACLVGDTHFTGSPINIRVPAYGMATFKKIAYDWWVVSGIYEKV